MTTLPIEIDAAGKGPLGMPAADFLRDYWQKRPLLIRNAFPGFTPPVSPDDLGALALQDGVLARLIVHDRKTDAWTVESAPLPEDRFDHVPECDWTLLVQDVDKWDPEVRALIDAFDFLPRWRIDDVMISFAVEGGGVGAHVDQYDVFLLQGMGRREWRISTDPRAPVDYKPDVPLKQLVHFDPSHRWVLEPGDMLYLPPGLGHDGVALEPAMTFSLGMRAPASGELIEDFAMYLAARHPENERYADPDLAAPNDPYEIDDAAFARVRAALPAFAPVEDMALREWFGRFITGYRASGEIRPPARGFGEAALAKALTENAVFERHPFGRYAWCRSGDAALLFASGGALTGLSVASASALCAAESLEAEAVRALDASGQVALLELTARGHYRVITPRKPRRR